MESGAVTNGNQRRTALDVALSSGITHEQYSALCEAATTHEVRGLGELPVQRLRSVRQLIRQGLITRDSITGFIANLRSYPVAGSRDAATLVQLQEIITVLLLFSERVSRFTDVEYVAVESIHAILTPFLRPGGVP